LGYYDLSDVNVMVKQAALAKEYGISVLLLLLLVQWKDIAGKTAKEYAERAASRNPVLSLLGQP
jgi:hypothetical protein